jgi:hypothetical protein
VDTSVASVAVLDDAVPIITEGDVITTSANSPLKVQLKNAAGDVVPGKQCYAIMTTEYGNRLVMKFRRKLRGIKNKELLGAVSTVSDSDGLVEFPRLRFSIYGSVEIRDQPYDDSWNGRNKTYFGFVVACDGVYSAEVLMKLRSRVHKVIIKRFIRKEANVAAYQSPEAIDSSDTFLAVTRVLDKNGKGVPGKTLDVTAVGEEPILTAVEAAREVTNEAGFSVVPFRAILLGTGLGCQTSQQFRVFFYVDGVDSAESVETLTATAQRSTSPTCNFVLFNGIDYDDPGSDFTNSQTIPFDDYSTRPFVLSGAYIRVHMIFFAHASDKTLTLDPNASICNNVAAPSGDPAAGRRLQSNRIKEHMRKLAQDDELRKVPRRTRQLSQDGSLKAELLATSYSNDGKEICYLTEDGQRQCTVKIPHQPSLIDANFVDLSAYGFPLPTLQDLQAGGGGVVAPMQVNAPHGAHYLKFKATIDVPGYAKTECYTQPQLLDVWNIFRKLRLTSSGTEEAVSGKMSGAVKETVLKLSLTLDDWVDPDAGYAAGLIQALHYDTDQNVMGAVYARWVQAPLPWNPTLCDPSPGCHPSPYIEISEVSGYALDGKTITMTMKISVLSDGILGDFALMFGVAGTWSNVYSLTVEPPEGLTLEVIQEPSILGNASIRAQMILPQQPLIAVRANGVGLRNAIVFADVVGEDGSYFASLSEIDSYDVTNLRVSQPSDDSGIAIFSALSVMDGQGCARFRFHLGVPGGPSTPLVPLSAPICFTVPFTTNIVMNPPPTLPVGISLENLESFATRPFTVQLIYGDGKTDFLNYGLAMARISIVNYNGEELDLGQVEKLSHEVLDSTICIWSDKKELLGRCGDLNIATVDGQVIATFTVRKLAWIQRDVHATIKLHVSDLSLSTLRGIPSQVSAPAGMADFSKEELAEACMNGLAESLARVTPVTSEIAPELKPATILPVLQPPSLVDVGSTFLVRVRVLTSSGGPIAFEKVRVALVASKGISASTADFSQLQELRKTGNKISSYKSSNAELDPDNIVKESNAQGMVSFPLSVWRGGNGQYVLKFQVENPSASVLYTTPTFMVSNPITSVTPADAAWGTLEVPTFEEAVQIPKQLRFTVSTSGSTLEELEVGGLRLSIRLELKGMSKKLQDTMAKLNEEAQQVAKSAADNAVQAAGQAAEAAKDSMFSKLDPAFADQCRTSGLSGLMNMGKDPSYRSVSTTDSIASDPSVVAPGEAMGQFMSTMTGAGTNMGLSSQMKGKLVLELGSNDIQLVDSGSQADGSYYNTYEVIRESEFHFEEKSYYVWQVSVNGVASKEDAFEPFQVTQIQLTPAELGINWFLSGLAFVFAVCILATNTRSHHPAWLLGAIPLTIAMACVIHFTDLMKASKQALGGNWEYIAIADLFLILICVFWGLLSELHRVPAASVQRLRAGKLQKFLSEPFGEKRDRVFEQYVKRRLLAVLAKRREPFATDGKPLLQIKQMLKPLNGDTAFYWPSKMWIAMLLSFGTFAYASIQVVMLLENVESGLMSTVNKVNEQIVNALLGMDGSFSEAISSQLPGDAFEPLHKQLKMMRDGFLELIWALILGCIIGFCFAVVVILAILIGSLVNFRYRVLECRRGNYTFKISDATINTDAMFMGQFIASIIIGFITLVLLGVIVVLPVAWSIPRNLIWSLREWILFTLLVPKIANIVLGMIVKKLIYGKDFILHRGLASFYIFVQTILSIPGGIMTGLVRFGISVGMTFVAMPQIFSAGTPDFTNRYMLLDSAHKTYLGGVYVHHLHNHPMVCWFAKYLGDVIKTRKPGALADASGTESKQGWRATVPQKKRWLILILITMPWLTENRKAALKEKKENAAQDVKAEKINVATSKEKASPLALELIGAIVQAKAKRHEEEEMIRKLCLVQNELKANPNNKETEQEIRRLLDEAQISGRVGL